MKFTLQSNKKTVEVDSTEHYFFSEDPDEKERIIRKSLGIPIKKDIVYYKHKNDINSACKVTAVRFVEMYEITDKWFTLEITLSDGSAVFIHSSYLEEMQKNDFITSNNN